MSIMDRPMNKMTHAGRGPKGYMRTDARILEDVCEALTWDRDVDASDIEVKVNDGSVTLIGRVESKQMKRKAEDCVERVDGVKDVRNEVQVVSATDQHLQTTMATGVY